MAVSKLNAAASGGKTAYRLTLLSGTSWTVPAGVTYINATLIGGGGAGSQSRAATNTGTAVYVEGQRGLPGARVTTLLSGLTPGNTITYAIGAGGTGGATYGAGGTTTMTGATSASGGGAASGATGTQSAGHDNGGGGGSGGGAGSGQSGGGTGGAGAIEIEYWV